jgi:hypothetical protein
MNNSSLYTAALTLCLALGSSLAGAVEPAPADIAQHRAMTPQEYESYRAELQHKIEQVSPPSQNKGIEEPIHDQVIHPESGYGQGYRARVERNDRASKMNGHQGGAMSRSGGRNR